jgi:TolB protein
MMDLSGANKRELTVGDFEFGAIPTFSPTNSQVTYAAWSHDERSNNYTNPQIVVRDLLSGVVKPITDGRSESWRPVFSPDERQLVYISRINNQYDLFSYDFSTASERRLTKTPFDEWDPQFSPNGSHLVYAAHADNNWDLFLLNLKTNITIQLTATKGDEWDPSISPDGSLILFAGQFGLVDAVYSMPYPR